MTRLFIGLRPSAARTLAGMHSERRRCYVGVDDRDVCRNQSSQLELQPDDFLPGVFLKGEMLGCESHTPSRLSCSGGSSEPDHDGEGPDGRGTKLRVNLPTDQLHREVD